MKTKEEFDLSLYLRQLILPDESRYCDIVDSSTTVAVINKVGLDSGEDADGKILNSLNEAGEETSRYTKCTSSCVLPVDKLEEGESRSKVKLQLQAGIPKLYEGTNPHPFSKVITITSGETRHTMYVVIAGDYSDGPSNSFALPTHGPLLIIRDPP